MSEQDKGIYIELLGHTRLQYAEMPPLDLPPVQANALLALLALNLPKGCSREELIEFLWPEEDSEVSRHRLRNCLHALRRQFEDQSLNASTILLTSRSTIALNPSLVCTDVAKFEELLRLGMQSTLLREREEFLKQTVQQYHGELLPGFYQGVFTSERERLGDLYEKALYTLTQICEQTGNLEYALACALRLVTRNPLHEEAHISLMRLYAIQGQASSVLRQYQELERVLREEWDAAPAEETRLFMESLHRNAQANITARSNSIPRPLLQRSPETAPDTETFPDKPPVSFASTSPPRLHLRRLLSIVSVVIVGLFSLWIVKSHFPRLIGISSPKPPSSALRPGLSPGQQLWAARYQPDAEEKNGGEPTAIATDGVGNIYITGFIQTKNHDVDYLTLKYDPNGHLLWHRRYNGTGNDVDRARAIAVDRQGNVYVTGDSSNGKGNGQTRMASLDIVTIKYDKDGHEIWVQRFNGADDGEEWVAALVLSPTEQEVYVSGISRSRQRSNGGEPRADGVLLKYDSNGHKIWSRYVSASDIAGQLYYHDMAIDAQGNVYVGGSIETVKDLVRNEDFLLVKYMPDGELDWRRTYGDPHNGEDSIRRVRVDASGNIYVVGTTDTGDPADKGGHVDVQTIKYDPTGDVVWKNTKDVSHLDDRPNGLAVTAEGAVGICGEVVDTDLFAMYYDEKDNVQWDKTYNGTGSFRDNATAIAFDSKGYLLVTGWAWNGQREGQHGTNWDYVTFKYGPKGEVIWKTTYDHDGLDDKAYALAIDHQDNILVAGQSDNGDNTASIVLVKYAP